MLLLRKLLLFLVVLGLSAPAAAEDPPAPPATESEISTLRSHLHPVSDEPARRLLRRSRDRGEGLSQGTTSTGTLVRGVVVPMDGERLRVMRSHHERNRNFAARGLARALTDAADAVAKAYPDSVVYLGDISAEGGGDLDGHKSHNCGRDADVAFFVKNAEGERVNLSSFVDFDAEGICCKGKYRFDVERNWLFVKTLIEHEHEAQYIFLYDPLKQLLISHAKSSGEPEALVEKAQSILRQPSDSARHDDHFHVRIFCTRRDVVEGCLNRGPRWPWARLHNDALSYRASILLDFIAHERSSARREDALDFLEDIEARSAASSALAERLLDSTLDREEVLETLDDLGVHEHAAAALEVALEAPRSPEETTVLLELLGRTGNVSAIPTLARFALHPGEGAQEARIRERAVRELVGLRHRDTVPALLALLEAPDVAVASRAHAGLQRLANRVGHDMDLEEGVDRTALVEDWRGWWTAHKETSREAWLVEGFVALGIEMEHIRDTRAVPALIAAQTTTPDFVALNAHNVIMHTVGYWYSPYERPSKRQRFWEAWWAKNAWRYAESGPDEEPTQ